MPLKAGIILFPIIIIFMMVVIVAVTIKKNKAKQINNKSKEKSNMKYCSTCGNELHDNAVVCIKCGCAITSSQTYSQTLDANSTGLNILSFFFPIIGLVLYLVYKDEKPIKSEGCKNFALIGFITNIILTIISTIIIIAMS